MDNRFIKTTLLAMASALLLSACASTPAKQGAVKITETTSFSDIDAKVDAFSAKYGAENVLIVSDIDNTLLTSATDLGGDIWYQWQRGKLDIQPTEEQKVSCLFEDTIGLLYELNPMRLTDPLVPELVATWQMSGNTVMALTSRDPRYRAATERELESNGIDMTKSPLTTVDGVLPEYRDQLERELTYSHGVMMTTGMNKGDMLHWILEKTGRDFDAVVFIDDSEKNIDDMYEAWKDSGTDMQIFYYTHVEESRVAAFGKVLTQQQADKMAADYNLLHSTLMRVFPARPAEHCLTVN